MHGYEIASAIQRTSDDVLLVEQESLYPALRRMLVKGLGESVLGHNRRESTGALLPIDCAGG